MGGKETNSGFLDQSGKTTYKTTYKTTLVSTANRNERFPFAKMKPGKSASFQWDSQLDSQLDDQTSTVVEQTL